MKIKIQNYEWTPTREPGAAFGYEITFEPSRDSRPELRGLTHACVRLFRNPADGNYAHPYRVDLYPSGRNAQRAGALPRWAHITNDYGNDTPILRLAERAVSAALVELQTLRGLIRSESL